MRLREIGWNCEKGLSRSMLKVNYNRDTHWMMAGRYYGGVKHVSGEDQGIRSLSLLKEWEDVYNRQPQ